MGVKVLIGQDGLGRQVYELSGSYLSYSNEEDYEDRVAYEQAFTSIGARDLVLDFVGITKTDGQEVGLIVKCAFKLASNGKKVYVKNLQPHVLEMLKQTVKDGAEIDSLRAVYDAIEIM